MSNKMVNIVRVHVMPPIIPPFADDIEVIFIKVKKKHFTILDRGLDKILNTWRV
jgi:hypothetical protein